MSSGDRLASNPKFAAAFAKCAGLLGGFGAGRLGGEVAGLGGNQRERAEVVSYTACMKQHGVNLPAPNFSGSGSVFPNTVNRTTTAFRSANAKCQRLLTFLPPTSGTSAGARSNAA